MAKYYDADGNELTGAAVEQAAATGNLYVDSAQPTVVRSPDGAAYEIDANQLGDFLGRGYSLESDDQAAAEQSLQEAQRAPIQAGAEALARGATLGLTDVVGGAISDEYAEGAQARREALGGIATGLEIAGGVGAGLASGGAGLVGRAAAMTPAGMLARGAATAGGRLEAALAARGVSAGVAKIAGMGVEGALDGAVSNVGATLSEASLGDTELTAEQLVAAGGIGALLGGFGGAATGAITTKVGSKIRQIADKYQPVVPGSVADEVAPGIAPRVTQEVVEEVGGKDAGFYRHIPDAVKQRVISRVSPDDRSLVGEVFESRQLRDDIINERKLVDESALKIKAALEDVVNTDHVMRDIGAGAVKAENVRRTIRTDTGPEALQMARTEIIAPWRAKLDELHQRELMSSSEYKDLVREVAHVEETIAKGFTGEMPGGAFNRKTGAPLKGSADAADSYVTLENFKRSVGNRVKRLANAKRSDDTVQADKAAELEQVAFDTRERLQKYLEREDLFGEVATQQRERNWRWRKTIQSGKMFDDQLVGYTGAGLDDPDAWFEAQRYIKGDKTETFLKKINDPKQSTEVNLTKDHIRDKLDLYKHVRETGQVQAAKVEMFQKAEAGLQRALDALETDGSRLQKVAQFKAIEGAEKAAMGFGAHLPLLSGVVGGIPGLALGAVAGVATQPVGAMRKLMQLEAMANHIRGQKQSVAAQTKLAITRLAKPPEKRSKLAISKAATAYFGRDRTASRERARKLETRLSEYRANPQRLADALAYQSREIAEFAPGVTANTAITTQRGIQFLDSKLPPLRKSNNTLQPQLNQRLWTDADVDKMIRYTRAIAEPETVLQDLEAGQLSPEAIEAVKAVYPKKFQEMQIEAAEVLATQQDELPHSAAIQLALLFDVPGVPTMSPAFQKTFRAMREQTAQKTQQQATGGNPSPAAETPQVKANTNFADQLGQGLESP